MNLFKQSYENGWDPDNITTPLIAAFGDFFTLPSIILAVILVSFISAIYLVKLALFAIVVIIVASGLVYGYTHESSLKHIVKQSTPVLSFVIFSFNEFI